MNNKLWHLISIGPRPEYDVQVAFVIRANKARKMASQNASDEGKSIG